jgi:transcriptional repressor NrdR
MKCPFCKKDTDTRVIESRSIDNDTGIRRRRECMSCKKRFTTHERIKEWDLLVVKRNKTREAFNRDKIESGIFRAFEKRKTSSPTLEALIDTIEQELRESFPKEVPSKEIGHLILQKIKQIDEVAYIRFASVYRKFEDANQFIEEIKTIRMEEKK